MKRDRDQGFDCIKIKRDIQSRIHEETKGMSHEEFNRYLKAKIQASRFAKYSLLDRSVHKAG